MVTETTNEKGSSGVAKTGLGLGIGALALVALQNGGLGGILGGRPPLPPPASKEDVAYERQLTTKDMEIAKLNAQLYTDQQVNELRRELSTSAATQAVINAQQSGVIGLLQSQVASLTAMTSPYIKQPVMAASEAALAYKVGGTSTASTANG